MITRISLFSFRKRQTENNIKNCKAYFLNLPDKIPGIISVEWGRNREQCPKFTHCKIVKFDSELSYYRYLNHPDYNVLDEMLTNIVKNKIIFVF